MSHPRSRLRLSDSQCRLIVVQDQLQPCPYLPDTTARMPLQLPVGPVSLEVVDLLLEAGFRRSGDFVYRPQCPNCSACLPTRVVVERFQMTSSMRRVLNRGDRELSIQWGAPEVDQDRVDMFNEHRLQRDLCTGGERIDQEAYRSFLADSCCQSRELSMKLNGRLVGISIVDVGQNSTSAVYTHFRPDAERYSLGTYAILKQIEWARQTGLPHVYLGMYVAENRHLNYKSRFQPQQRLIDNRWQDVEA